MHRVLIVDDDATFATACCQALRYSGYLADSAGAVESALSALKREVPTALILDWKLPDGNGLRVLQWLEAHAHAVPTAVITGFWGDPDCDRAMSEAQRLGAIFWLRRGIDIADPTEVVQRLLASGIGNQHGRTLCEANGEAGDLLVSQLLKAVVPRLRALFHSASSEMICDSVVDAVLDHLNHPGSFDPSRNVPLAKFIFFTSRRNLLNSLQTEARYRARYVPIMDVHLHRLQSPPADCPHDPSVIRLTLLRETDPAVRTALRQWLDGDTTLEPWVSLHRFQGLPSRLLARQVKRIKDSFIARCKRTPRS